MKNSSWHYIEKQVGLEEVKEIENKLNLKFPIDFVEFTLKNGGGRPEFDCLEINDGNEYIFNYLVSFDSNSKHNYIMKNQNVEGLQEGLLVIADDGFGNFWCYDYRKIKDNPPIVYWNHDYWSITPAFNSFSELLDNLYEYKE